MVEDFNPNCPETLELLLKRRSGKAIWMGGDAPNEVETHQILAAAARVPDHGKLAPWRFIVAKDAARDTLGQAFEAAWCDEEDETSDIDRKKWREFPLRAPMMITVVACESHDHPIPVFEQHLSVGAACQNLMLATHALGYLANWLTGWAAYSPSVANVLGLDQNERVAGFIFIGQCDRPLTERQRPVLNDIIEVL